MFPVDVINIIVGYAPAYEVHPYINRLLECDKFDIKNKVSNLCSNPCDAAIEMIRNNSLYMQNIDWDELSKNPCNAAADLLFEYKENISDYWISYNINKRTFPLHGLISDETMHTLNCRINKMRDQFSDEDINILINAIENGMINGLNNYSISIINSSRLIRFISEYKGGRGLDYTGLCINGCDAAVDILYPNIDEDIKDGIISARLNLNPNDRIVDYLFEHKQYINDKYFIKNSNARVVQYYSDKINNLNYGDFIRNKGCGIYNVLEDMANRGVVFYWHHLQIYHLSRPNIFIEKKNNALYDVLHSM